MPLIYPMYFRILKEPLNKHDQIDVNDKKGHRLHDFIARGFCYKKVLSTARSGSFFVHFLKSEMKGGGCSKFWQISKCGTKKNEHFELPTTGKSRTHPQRHALNDRQSVICPTLTRWADKPPNPHTPSDF